MSSSKSVSGRVCTHIVVVVVVVVVKASVSGFDITQM